MMKFLKRKKETKKACDSTLPILHNPRNPCSHHRHNFGFMPVLSRVFGSHFIDVIQFPIRPHDFIRALLLRMRGSYFIDVILSPIRPHDFIRALLLRIRSYHFTDVLLSLIRPCDFIRALLLRIRGFIGLGADLRKGLSAGPKVRATAWAVATRAQRAHFRTPFHAFTLPSLQTSPSGFTLVEVLIALSIVGLLTVMLFTSFHSVTNSWNIGRATIDAGGHSDFLMEQLTAALRSAYYPGSGEKYGLIFTDDGEDEFARDWIEWTKVGPALVGEDAEFAEVPHRVRVFITDPEGDFPGGFTIRAWRQDLQLDDFNPEEDTAELVLSPKVIAFNCRMLDPETERTADDELNWMDEWTKTNTLPTAVELTLWLQPADDDAEPIESQRIVEIPMGVLSQNPTSGASATDEAKRGTSTTVPGGGSNLRPGNRPTQGRPGGQTGGQTGGGMRPSGGGQGGGLRPGGGGGMRPPDPNGGGGLFRPM